MHRYSLGLFGHKGRALVACTAAIVAILGAGAPALARGGDKVDEPKVRAVLDRLDRAQREIKTFRAELVETRELAVLDKPDILRGTLTFARPGKIRWQYDAPDARIYVLADGQLTGWIPGENRAEKLDVSKRRGQIERLIGLGQDANSLDREFRITLGSGPAPEGTDELVLVPRSRRVKRRVQEIRLAVDRENGLPRVIRYMTGDGDKIALEMRAFTINPQLAANAFDLQIPAGAKIVEGLSSLGIPGQDDDENERAN